MTSVRVLLSVCAVCAVAAAALATPMPFPAEGQPVDDKVAPVAPAEAAPPPTSSERQPLDMDSEDLGRRKKIKKGNSTIGEEVLGAIVDGLSGESEDAKFGSEIRQQFGFLIDAVANLSVATINKYASSRAAEPMAVGGQDHARTARAVDNVGEGEWPWPGGWCPVQGEASRQHQHRLAGRRGSLGNWQSSRLHASERGEASAMPFLRRG